LKNKHARSQKQAGCTPKKHEAGPPRREDLIKSKKDVPDLGQKTGKKVV